MNDQAFRAGGIRKSEQKMSCFKEKLRKMYVITEIEMLERDLLPTTRKDYSPKIPMCGRI